MAAILHQLDQRRLIDSNGIADGSSIYFYVTETLTPAPVYTTAALDVEHPSPIVVPAGAAVPDIYLDSSITYRRRIVYGDGSVDDTDPWEGGIVRGSDLASTDTGKGAALFMTEAGVTGQDWFDRWKDTRDFGTNALTQANFMLSLPNRTEGYELDLRQTGAAFDFDPSDDSGTDDSGAIQEGLDWLDSKGGGIARLPWGNALIEGAGDGLLVPAGVTLLGADNGGQNATSRLYGGATSGPVIRIKEGGVGLKNFWIGSTDARWAATATDGHGVLAAPDDTAGSHFLARQQWEGVYVERQPTDAWHGIGTFELSRFSNLWGVSCKRHGFAFDNGYRAGYTNKTENLFMVTFDRVRAMDCGGNAILIGNTDGTNVPQHVVLDHAETLGCGWDTSAREYLEQIFLRGRDLYLNQPDVEDQQYANTTLTNTGDSKTGRATPSGGIRLYTSSVGFMLVNGHYSSLMNWLVVENGAVGLNIDVSGASEAQGAYATNVAVGYAIGTGTGTGRFIGNNTSKPATKYAAIRSLTMNIEVNGSRYRSTSSSVIDTGIFNGDAPTSATISGGVLTAASLNVLVVGEGSAADTLDTFRYVSGINGIGGDVLRLHYGAQDITISNAGNFLFKDGETSLTLDASYPVATFVYNTATTKWVEQ